MMNNRQLSRLLDKIERKIKPKISYQCSDSVISLYKAKDVLKKKWNNPNLKKLTLYCRQSYLRYGKRPLLDKYDAKAGIYLASVSYPILSSDSNICMAREWLSVRLVPGNGRPLGAGELEIYKFQGKRLDLVIKDKFFDGDKRFWNKIVSSSRMCGIDPYIVNSNKNSDDPVLPKRHAYLAECFALIQWQFIQDGDMFYDYITEIIPNKLADKALVVKRNGSELKPGSKPAHKLLNLAKKDIKLDRRVYSYQFPLYWLNMDQLSRLLRRLLKEGYLSERTLHYYLKTKLSYDEVIENPRLLDISRLGKLLSVENRIKWSKITGPKLRKLVDKYVEDEPELKITSVHVWNRAILNIVKTLNVRIV